METLRRTKIVCTMGPSTEDDYVLREMLRAGMNVARLNFSHGTYDYHRANIERVRRIADELGTTVAIMVDTKGPEIRTGVTKDHQPVMLEKGSHVTVTTDYVEGTSERFYLDYAKLPSKVHVGSLIYVDDGLIGLVVEKISEHDILCTVANGGVLKEHKGVNIPGVELDFPAVTDRDKADLAFAAEMQVDAIAASFVCSGNAVRELRSYCDDLGLEDAIIISKIESAQAMADLDDILEASDGIMVARGDLGIEVPPAQVPQIQKIIIRKCNKHYLPVITATQMLESMTVNPRPTRAEVTDVANAIYDGTDCVMLSGETAAGKYPLEAVKMMSEICLQAEKDFAERHIYFTKDSERSVSSTIGFAAVQAAEHVGATAILCPTGGGKTARIMSTFRSHLPIIATSPAPETVRRTNFYWGVQGLLTHEQSTLTQICYDSLKAARKAGYVAEDDLVVITAGDPLTSPLTNNGYETATNVCMIAQAM